MDEGSVNFKALRAKFQEDASLVQSKSSRPAVAEKPKTLPPSGGHCCSVVSSINIAVENRTPVVPRVVFRDGLQSAGKRPVSFPPKVQQTPPSFQHGSGDTTTRQSLRERHMPLVLPFIPIKEHKSEPPASRELKVEEDLGKEAGMQTKIKKKGLLLPFKSSKAAKTSGENGEEPPCCDLLRLSAAPGEFSSLGKQPLEDGLPRHSDQSTEFSSPDLPLTPPPTDASVESDNKIISTLEKAKKKLSCRQMLISAKSLCSPDVSRDKAFPPAAKKPQSSELELHMPSPVCLPNLSCLSARPFFRANTLAQKAALDRQFGKERAELVPVRSSPPLKKPLAAPSSLGPVPPKPPRPPSLDLSCFRLHTFHAVPPCPGREAAAESTVVIDAPEFPDFDHSETETAEGESVDLRVLDLEALNLFCAQTPVPGSCEVPDFDSLPPFLLRGAEEPLMSSVISESLLEPDSLPNPPEPLESAPWSQTEEFSSHAAADGGNQPPSDSQPSELHQRSDWEAGDNVYEDVRSVKKAMVEQNWRKRRAALKNPYDDGHCTDGAGLHTWPRHPRKERQSPHTAEYKEQKKRDKQRLDKEKKEQREREKKENEMKKKFKVTGEEEPMYHARVTVASKVRKHDLPVKNGDTVSIIRTTSCPRGKWLARDANNRYGYISVMNVELNIQEMLELGKKAQAAGRGGTLEADTVSIGSRSSNHPVLSSSFTDDSEEWACEDETASFCYDSHLPPHTSSMAETSCVHVGAQHPLSDASLEDVHAQSRQEALQKLAVFFQHSRDEFTDVQDSEGATPTNAETPNLLSAVDEPPLPEQDEDLEEPELFPPPPLYADA